MKNAVSWGLFLNKRILIPGKEKANFRPGIVLFRYSPGLKFAFDAVQGAKDVY